MRVLLIIENYKNGFPFIQDLETNLRKRCLIVDVLDLDNGFIKKNDDTCADIFPSRALKKFIRIPKVGFLIKLVLLRRLFYNFQGRYDAVNIHYCGYVYVYIIRWLAKLANHLSVVVWGSDFYRDLPAQREKKKIIYDTCSHIIFCNPVNALDFVNAYKNYSDKSLITGFGNSKFDLIPSIAKVANLNTLKSEFNFPLDKYAVACGYNGREEQQHLKLIAELITLRPDIKELIFLVFQMTYSSDKHYVEEVKAAAMLSGIECVFLQNFMDDLQIAKYRLAVDIVLNAQTTDGFSASLQEHIIAQNILIVGDWLPYSPMKEQNIFFFSVPIGGFVRAVEHVVDHYDLIKPKTWLNAEEIYKISSWDIKINKWIDAFSNRVEDLKFDESKLNFR